MARPRRPSWGRCSWACACAARRSMSWRASRPRCASGWSGSRRPTAPSMSSGPAETAVGTFNISTAAALVVAAAGHPGRQARQPGDHLAGWRRGRARCARGPDRSRRRLGRGGAACAWLRVHVRPVLPSGDAPRRPDPARDRGPDGVQPPGSPHQSGRGHAHAPGCRGQCRGVARRRGRPAARHGTHARHPRRGPRRAAPRRQRGHP